LKHLQALQLLVVRDLQVRYAGTWLGYLWSLLDPLFMSLIYWMVFTVILGARGVGEQPYLLFLLAGMLPWLWLAGSLGDSSRALITENRLVRSIALPRMLWVIKSISAKGVEFVLALPILIALAIFFKKSVSWELLWFLVAFVLQYLLLIGIGLILAPLTVLARDMKNIIRLLVRLGFYLTPIIYSVSDIPAAGQNWSYLNPMTGIVTLYRAGFWPQGSDILVPLLAATLWSIGLFTVGIIFFKKIEATVLKEV
jgi:ABC-2 type transport system permease protein